MNGIILAVGEVLVVLLVILVGVRKYRRTVLSQTYEGSQINFKPTRHQILLVTSSEERQFHMRVTSGEFFSVVSDGDIEERVADEKLSPTMSEEPYFYQYEGFVEPGLWRVRLADDPVNMDLYSDDGVNIKVRSLPGHESLSNAKARFVLDSLFYGLAASTVWYAVCGIGFLVLRDLFSK